MTRAIRNFRAKLPRGGARNNLFRIIINYPSFVQGDAETTSLLCKGASIPASPMGKIPLNYRGRTFSLPGDRPEYEPWTATFFNDTGFSVHDAMMDWQEGINNVKSNTPDADPSQWYSDIIVEQLDSDERVLKRYKLVDAWPENVGQIEFNNDTTNAIEEFPVTFSYLLPERV